MSGPQSLIYPILAQVFWTFVVIVLAGRARVAAVRSRQVRLRDVALSSEAWPAETRKVANNMHNQYETPVLFYVLCGVATAIGATGTLMVLLAWTYVATRVIHTAIHVTTNKVRHRFIPFVIGLAALFLMWLLIVFRLLGAV